MQRSENAIRGGQGNASSARTRLLERECTRRRGGGAAGRSGGGCISRNSLSAIGGCEKDFLPYTAPK